MSNLTQQEIATPSKPIVLARDARSKQPIFGTTRWLAYTALFCALAIALKFFGQLLTLTESFKITLIYVIWLIAAAVLGPVGGGTVCFLSDLLPALIFPTGVINPLLCLGCTLFGVTAAFLFKLPIKSYYIRFAVAGTVCAVLYTLLFDSFAIWVFCKYYLHLNSFADKSVWVYIASRALQLGVAAINIAITVAAVPILTQLKLLPPIKEK